MKSNNKSNSEKYSSNAEDFNKNHLIIFFQKNIVTKNFLSSEFFLKNVAEKTSKNADKFKFTNIINNKIKDKKREISNSKTFQAKIKYKLLVGNGQEDQECFYQLNTVIKNSSLLVNADNKKINQSTIIHPVTLKPYLPGSSIHGAFRSYLVLKYKLEQDIIKILFGSVDYDASHVGFIRCFDAHCDTNDGLEVSIIKSQSGPLNFINVKKGVNFTFQISFRKILQQDINKIMKNIQNLDISNLKNVDINNIEDAIYVLFNDFLNNGSIGSRESVGWGEFEDVTEN